MENILKLKFFFFIILDFFILNSCCTQKWWESSYESTDFSVKWWFLLHRSI